MLCISCVDSRRESIIKRSRICELARKCASADCSARANHPICEGALHLLCEQGVYPIKNLAKQAKHSFTFSATYRPLTLFSIPQVLRRLENIVCRSRFHLRYLFRLLYIDTYICSLGNIPQAVCVRAAKATSDTPYFLRARREKQFLTVFPSFTLKVHGFALHGLEAARSFARKESRKNANEEHRQTRKNTKRL